MSVCQLAKTGVENERVLPVRKENISNPFRNDKKASSSPFCRPATIPGSPNRERAILHAVSAQRKRIPQKPGSRKFASSGQRT